MSVNLLTTIGELFIANDIHVTGEYQLICLLHCGNMQNILILVGRDNGNLSICRT